MPRPEDLTSKPKDEAEEVTEITEEMMFDKKSAGEEGLPDAEGMIMQDKNLPDTETPVTADMVVDAEAPGEKIGGDLGELDRDMEAKAIAKELVADLDETPAPAGKIEGDLAEMDAMLDPAAAKGIDQAKDDLTKLYEEKGEDSDDMKKAA